jgi:hypothetical protein
MPGCLDLNPYCDRLGLPRGVARHPLVYAWTNHPKSVIIAAAILVLVPVLVYALGCSIARRPAAPKA